MGRKAMEGALTISECRLFRLFGLVVLIGCATGWDAWSKGERQFNLVLIG
jgi:hypothetical protein